MFHKKGPHGQKRRTVVSSLFIAVLACTLVLTGKADALYILTGPEDTALVLDEAAAGKSFSSPNATVYTPGSGGPEITLTAGCPVAIRYQGSDLSATSQSETVSALLRRLQISPSPLDMIAVDVSEAVIRIEIASELTFYERVSEPESYSTVRRANPDMDQGTETLAQSGQDGTRTGIYEVIYSNGQLVSRQLVGVADSTSVPEVIEYGTRVDSVASGDILKNVTTDATGGGVLTFASGGTLDYSKALSMTATAYTSNVGKVGTITATGTRARVGAVAVDPRVIPLGSKLYIVTKGGIVYGTAVAEDTGVRGNIIDLYYDTYTQCMNFGRRPCTVYILED